MNNLTYNPNVNVPYHNSYNGMDMDFQESGGNFKNSNYNMQALPQMDPRTDYRNNQGDEQMGHNSYQMEPQMRQPMRQQFENYPKYNSKKKSLRQNYYDQDYDNKSYEEIDKFESTKSTKFDWILFAKKIVIYTALFLIMSHVKMDELVCKFVPFLSDNQILCMTFKGILLALVIILVQKIL